MPHIRHPADLLQEIHYLCAESEIFRAAAAFFVGKPHPTGVADLIVRIPGVQKRHYPSG